MLLVVRKRASAPPAMPRAMTVLYFCCSLYPYAVRLSFAVLTAMPGDFCTFIFFVRCLPAAIPWFVLLWLW